MLDPYESRFIKRMWILVLLNLVFHSICQAEGSISCRDLFDSLELKSGYSKIEKDLSTVRPPRSDAQKILELIQFIHDLRARSPLETVSSQKLNLLNEHLKNLKQKFLNLSNYNKTSDPDGGIPAAILTDRNLAQFLLSQVTQNTVNKGIARQILHQILSLAVVHFPDDYTSTNFYTIIRNTYNQSSGKMRDLISDVSDPVIFYDGVFANDLKNIGGEHADQVQQRISFLNRLVSLKALTMETARSIFEKEILNINPLPLNKNERRALVKSLEVEDRQVNVNSILELAGFKWVETEFFPEAMNEKNDPFYRTQFVLKFEDDPSVSVVFIDDSVHPPENGVPLKPTSYSLKGLDQIAAFFKNPKSNVTLQIHATTIQGLPN